MESGKWKLICVETNTEKSEKRKWQDEMREYVYYRSISVYN